MNSWRSCCRAGDCDRGEVGSCGCYGAGGCGGMGNNSTVAAAPRLSSYFPDDAKEETAILEDKIGRSRILSHWPLNGRRLITPQPPAPPQQQPQPPAPP
ncbi:hypothetical protein TIFTF001_021486 [Ficus carica]|uniref:Uncharacterized protein n=1 Tax=Ficus carica TaxID=3494 RepID=A0AA88AUY7_FICCA|nr:hypothetical protein TIFTF001_021486 [Ficus carica]